MHQITPEKGKLRTFALIRDSEGKPVIDDGSTLPAEIVSMLTPTEIEELRNDRFAFSRS